MSQAKPQSDLKFLNELLHFSEKKKLDYFTKNRAHKAVEAFRKSDNYQGSLALIDFYVYFNQFDEARALLKKFKVMYGDDLYLENIMSRMLQAEGDFEGQLKLYNRNLERIECLDELTAIEQENIDLFIDNALNCSIMYLIKNENLFHKFLPQETAEQAMEIIDYKINNLNVLGISLTTYQKFMTIINKLVHEKYYDGFSFVLMVEPEFSIAELSVVFNNITPEEAFDLEMKINNAILQECRKDEIFDKEVTQLSVNCTTADDSVEEEVLA